MCVTAKRKERRKAKEKTRKEGSPKLDVISLVNHMEQSNTRKSQYNEGGRYKERERKDTRLVTSRRDTKTNKTEARNNLNRFKYNLYKPSH